MTFPVPADGMSGDPVGPSHDSDGWAGLVVEQTFDTYGFGEADLEEARKQVERALAVTFALHTSTIWGGEYYWARTPTCGEIAIRLNFNEYTKKLGESEFPDCQVIVSVANPRDPDAVKERLIAAGLSFLQRSVVTAPERPRKNRP